jgi:hypothetical protein
MGSPDQPRAANGQWTAGSDAAAAGAHTRGIQRVPKPWGSGRPAKGQAARDRVIRGKGVDQRHFGITNDVGSRVGKMLLSDLRGKSARGWPFNN